jgi:hypothetical protein
MPGGLGRVGWWGGVQVQGTRQGLGNNKVGRRLLRLCGRRPLRGLAKMPDCAPPFTVWSPETAGESLRKVLLLY